MLADLVTGLVVSFLFAIWWGFVLGRGDTALIFFCALGGWSVTTVILYGLRRFRDNHG